MHLSRIYVCGSASRHSDTLRSVDECDQQAYPRAYFIIDTYAIEDFLIYMLYFAFGTMSKVYYITRSATIVTMEWTLAIMSGFVVILWLWGISWWFLRLLHASTVKVRVQGYSTSTRFQQYHPLSSIYSNLNYRGKWYEIYFFVRQRIAKLLILSRKLAVYDFLIYGNLLGHFAAKSKSKALFDVEEIDRLGWSQDCSGAHRWWSSITFENDNFSSEHKRD